MSFAARVLIGFLGLVAVAYSAANFAGAVTPPWRERRVPWSESFIRRLNGEAITKGGTLPREGREWISGAVGTVGLALVAFAAWPGRREPASP